MRLYVSGNAENKRNGECGACQKHDRIHTISLSDCFPMHNMYVVKSLSSFDTGNDLLFLSKNAGRDLCCLKRGE